MEKVYTEENEKKLLRLLNIYDLSTTHEQRKLQFHLQLFLSISFQLELLSSTSSLAKRY